MGKFRFICCLFVFTVFFSCMCNFSAIGIPVNVGLYNPREGDQWPEWADRTTVRKIVFNEYNRMLSMKSTQDNGVSYFDYGQSTDDLMVLGHMAFYYFDNNGDIAVYDQDYFIQQFVNGNSTGIGFPEGRNASYIIVTEESYKNGKAYTLRDDFATAYISYSTTSSGGFRLPTSNEYWIGATAYQNFEFGYLSSNYENNIFSYLEYDIFNSPPSVTQPELCTEERYEYQHKGDLDGNEKVSVSDIIALRKIIMQVRLPEESVRAKGDTDGDFSITVSDVISLRKMIMRGS